MSEATATSPKVTRGPRNAADNPVVRTAAGETHTADHQVGQQPPIILPGLDEPLVRENEEIAAIDKPMETNYFHELSFMEEMVTIRLEPSAEKNAAKIIDVYVNGRPEWIPVGRPWQVKRKYVEVLARAKPIDITTEHDSPQTAPNGEVQNRVLRATRVKHPFSIVQDANPRGIEWFSRLMAEG